MNITELVYREMKQNNVSVLLLAFHLCLFVGVPVEIQCSLDTR